jgi:hypothetical protein
MKKITTDNYLAYSIYIVQVIDVFESKWSTKFIKE